MSEGIYLTNEIDGLRVVTSGKTYFFDKVSDSLEAVFGICSLDPAADLSMAKKAIDMDDPAVDRIIRNLDQQDS